MLPLLPPSLSRLAAAGVGGVVCRHPSYPTVADDSSAAAPFCRRSSLADGGRQMRFGFHRGDKMAGLEPPGLGVSNALRFGERHVPVGGVAVEIDGTQPWT